MARDVIVRSIHLKPEILLHGNRDGTVVRRHLERMNQKVVRETRRAASQRLNSTHRYNRSLDSRVYVQNGKLRSAVSSSHPQAQNLEKGTRPHVIAGRGKNLTFYWAKLGIVISVPSVNHPGHRAYRILETGLRRAVR